MKIRSAFVDNSSSSSYIIGYSRKTFGNLNKFFWDNEHKLGYETRVLDREQMLLQEYPEESWDAIRQKMRKAEDDGMTILCINLDYEQSFLLDMLKQINDANGSDKMTIIDE